MLISKIAVSNDMLSSEQYLIDTCKEYSINYTTCELESTPVTEGGVISKLVDIIKTIFRKIISILVRVFKFIISILKRAINKAVDIFKRIFGIKTSKPIKLKVGVITKPGTVEEKIFNTPSDIANAFKNANQNFNSEILRIEQQNIGHTKRMEQQTTREIAREDYIEGLLERVVYNKGSHNSGLVKLAKMVNDYDDSDKDEMESNDLATQGDSLATHQQINTFDFLKTREMELVLESKNLCESYEVFKSNSINRLIEHALKISKDENIKNYDLHKQSMENVVKLAEAIMEHYKIPESEIDRYIACRYFPSFEDLKPNEKEAAIRKWLQLRVNWNNGIIGLLRSMIVKNQQLLSISDKSLDAILKDLDKGDIEGARWALKRAMKNVLSDDLTIMDGRKLGLGVICISDDMVGDEVFSPDDEKQVTNAGAFSRLLDVKNNDMAITYMTKYDLTILAHGGDDEENHKWFMQKIIAPDGSYPGVYDGAYTDVVEYIRYVIKLGFKRINLISCNPGHYELPDDIKNSKKAFVRMSMKSTLASQ